MRNRLKLSRCCRHASRTGADPPATLSLATALGAILAAFVAAPDCAGGIGPDLPDLSIEDLHACPLNPLEFQITYGIGMKPASDGFPSGMDIPLTIQTIAVTGAAIDDQVLKPFYPDNPHMGCAGGPIPACPGTCQTWLIKITKGTEVSVKDFQPACGVVAAEGCKCIGTPKAPPKKKQYPGPGTPVPTMIIITIDPTNIIHESDEGNNTAKFLLNPLAPQCPTGAACLPDGKCIEGVTASQAEELGADYLGDFSSCLVICPPQGACMIPDSFGGGCYTTTGQGCASIGGQFLGPGSKCPSELPCPWDLNGDGVVNGFDLAMLLAAWGPCINCLLVPCPADFDGNCIVNGFDLAILLAQWGPCPGALGVCCIDQPGECVEGVTASECAQFFGGTFQHVASCDLTGCIPPMPEAKCRYKITHKTNFGAAPAAACPAWAVCLKRCITIVCDKGGVEDCQESFFRLFTDGMPPPGPNGCCVRFERIDCNPTNITQNCGDPQDACIAAACPP